MARFAVAHPKQELGDAEFQTIQANSQVAFLKWQQSGGASVFGRAGVS